MHLATAVTRNKKSPISAHAFIVLIVDLKWQLNRRRAIDQQAIGLMRVQVRARIPVSGFKQQRKVSFDKSCCLNPEEYGICIDLEWCYKYAEVHVSKKERVMFEIVELFESIFCLLIIKHKVLQQVS